MFRKFLVLAVVAVTASILAPSRSEAGFSVVLTGTAPVLAARTVSDRVGGSAVDNNDDLAGLKGIIQLSDAGNGILSTYNGLTIRFTATSSAPAAFSSSLQTTTNATISNTTNSAVSITILVSDDTFVTPGNGDYVLRNDLTVVTLSGPGTTISSSSSATSNPAVTPTATASAVTPTAVSTEAFWTRTNSPTPFTLGTLITLTIGAGGAINFQTNLDVVNATPAPAGLILAALGIPAFGLLRRIGRKTGAAEVAVAA